LALLYILCQPGIEVNERDHMGLTALHWAVQQGDEDSTRILLKFGADPKAVDRNGLTTLHWAASGGNPSCITQLLESRVDIRALSRDRQTAEEMAAMYHNRGTWNAAVAWLGFKPDGTRVRRPLSEVCGRVGPQSLLSVRCQQQVWWMLICPGCSPV
jgi:ankyrin repeat protein